MRQIVLCFVLSLFLSSSEAQVAGHQIYAGYNFSSFVGSLESGDKRLFRFGWTFGYAFTKPLTRGLALRPEMQFSSQGTQQTNKFFELHESDSSEINRTRESTIALKAINFPLLLEYGNGKKFKLLAGPYLGLISSAKIENKFTIVRSSSSSNLIIERSTYSLTEQSTKPFHIMDLGVVFGLQIVPSENLALGMRMQRGFTDITKDHHGYGSGPDSQISFKMFLAWLL